MDEKDRIDKIKELLKNDSYEIRESGLELARSLNNPIIYDGLLGTWDKNLEMYNSDKSSFLEFGNAHPDFNNYILCSLIIEASASSFYIGYKPSLIKKLSLNRCAVKNLDFLSNMPNLSELQIDDYGLDNLDGWSYLSNLTNLTFLYINSNLMTNVSFLKKLTKIKNFKFRGGENIENMDGIAELINLEILGLYETPFNLVWYDAKRTGNPDDAEVEEESLASDQLAVWFSYMFGSKHVRAYRGKSTYDEEGCEILEDGSCGEVADFRHQLY